MTLTKREEKMLGLLTRGATSQQVAAAVKLTDGTTRIYLHRLYKKIRVKNKTQAAMWYARRRRTA